MDRRGILRLGLWAAGAAGALALSPTRAQIVVKEVHDLLPGEFTWNPDRSPRGPMAIIVSIPEQRVHVYRNAIRIAVSTCSTGAPGHATPTGVFTILEKDRHHRSSTYNNAPMPNMNRLTWQGIALHAGNLPGYPASHGCVRLPLAFSARLFEITHVGTPVIIAGAHGDPQAILHPGLVLGRYAEDEFADAVTGLGAKKHPADWAEGERAPITTMIASSADRSIVMLENGEEVARGRLIVSGAAQLGEHVLLLQGADADRQGLAWHGISHRPDPGQPGGTEEMLIRRLTADAAFVAEITRRLHPGMMMIVTDLPLTPDARSGRDFVVMAQADG